MRTIHKENHLIQRIGWLRAAVLGANDGIISTASLILGVASASSAGSEALVAGVAGLVAGAMSMAAGEYVSVSSQFDTEHADLARETSELASDPEHEEEELTEIYAARGVEIGLAREVARQLMTKDALGAHARDELGISEATTARPVQAALASAATFTVGAAAPLILTMLSPRALLLPMVAIGSLLLLALLGMLGATAGGAGILRPTIRVTFWGALAMALTIGIGGLFGKVGLNPPICAAKSGLALTQTGTILVIQFPKVRSRIESSPHVWRIPRDGQPNPLIRTPNPRRRANQGRPGRRVRS